jgi:hypothetical protein
VANVKCEYIDSKHLGTSTTSYLTRCSLAAVDSVSIFGLSPLRLCHRHSAKVKAGFAASDLEIKSL